jgi:hypothetical protein
LELRELKDLGTYIYYILEVGSQYEKNLNSVVSFPFSYYLSQFDQFDIPLLASGVFVVTLPNV